MNVRRSCWLSISVVLVALAATGCDSPGLSRKAKTPASVKTAEGSVPVGETTTTGAGLDGANGAAANDTFRVQTQGLAVSDEIAAACGIQARAGTAPSAAKFEFDSAALSEEDRAMLGEVARCLSDGPLRDRKVVLTGRADARGEPEYNMTLGESRADAVLRYMVDLGVGKPRMTATSRGELDAVGTDEAGFAQDRRVDITLAP